MTTETLTDYDKFLIKHINLLIWMDSLQADYEVNKLKVPVEMTYYKQFLENFLGHFPIKKLEQLTQEAAKLR